MVTKKIRIISAVAALFILFVAVSATTYIMTPQSASKPFAFRLSTYPKNETSMQGQNLTIRVDVVYLEGTPEPVSLAVSGGPNGTIYQFSNQTGIPNSIQPFRSNLTIFLPNSGASGSYSINVLSNSNSQTNHGIFNLTVLATQIQVSGTVTILSNAIINGATIDVIPTHIVFESNTTSQAFQAKIDRFTDTRVAPGKTGNYSISLPNQQSYHVGFYCISFPHYIPIFRVATTGIKNGCFTVDCSAGTDSIIVNFTG